jgi:uracil-DNA glycosylase
LEGKTIYPSKDKIFRALEECPLDNVKVVILGQDPYHTPGVATGLAFDVSDYSKPQPSLRNIFIEMSHDIESVPNNFDELPAQGVLLLNTALTVEEREPNIHKDLWDPFTKELLGHISQSKDFVVFVLWGANAISYLPYIDQKKHKIVASSHPSPFSWEKPCGKFPPFKGSKPFTQINKFLKTKKIEEIKW